MHCGAKAKVMYEYKTQRERNPSFEKVDRAGAPPRQRSHHLLPIVADVNSKSSTQFHQGHSVCQIYSVSFKRQPMQTSHLYNIQFFPQAPKSQIDHFPCLALCFGFRLHMIYTRPLPFLFPPFLLTACIQTVSTFHYYGSFQSPKTFHHALILNSQFRSSPFFSLPDAISTSDGKKDTSK